MEAAVDLDWHKIDRWLVGESWVGSKVQRYLTELCTRIGPRWGGSEGDRRAASYIRAEMERAGLVDAHLEEFDLKSWDFSAASGEVVEDSRRVDLIPILFCPPTDVTGRLVDVGFGMPHEVESVRDRIRGAAAVMNIGFEPFTTPLPVHTRLNALADTGVAIVVLVESRAGRKLEFQPANDWRYEHVQAMPVPTVLTTREDGALLRLMASEGKRLHVQVASRYFETRASNTVAELRGGLWPDQTIILGAHHDTVWGAPGGNDNASGTVVVMETARLLAALQRATGVAPGCTIRFCTFSGEEQTLQGSRAYVRRHFGGGRARWHRSCERRDLAAPDGEPGRAWHRQHEGDGPPVPSSAPDGADCPGPAWRRPQVPRPGPDGPEHRQLLVLRARHPGEHPVAMALRRPPPGRRVPRREQRHRGQGPPQGAA
ncbi:MAG: M28 family peptidase [SAR202 cluster bacterium]|nr:M28 family peptidase [SAR202 cluster bacterium]